eukprot:TRINITY_DN16580_c0_g1_i2.p1 TRINITY_DN16580_c0_g1~~TRINITY_DN16580_c0_g1_i2.p1  ORF type:complete len:568 (+),score=164.67 TRINITY_DN16580_c0_g1_i2:454-2157(+)
MLNRNCPEHGTEFIQWKCRYCCSLSSYECFGYLHVCDTCHPCPPLNGLMDFSGPRDKNGHYRNLKPLNEYLPCPVMPGHKTALEQEHTTRTKLEGAVTAAQAAHAAACEQVVEAAAAACTALRQLHKPVRVEATERQCIECDVSKPRAEYSSNQWKAGVHSARCVSCVAAKMSRGHALTRKRSKKIQASKQAPAPAPPEEDDEEEGTEAANVETMPPEELLEAVSACKEWLLGPQPTSPSLEQSVSFTDLDGDRIQFRVVNNTLQESVNEEVVIEAVPWLGWQDGRMRDSEGSIPVPAGRGIEQRVAALAQQVGCEWRGEAVEARSRGVPARGLGSQEGSTTVYCGEHVGTVLLPGSDGHCGPSNGPQCAQCEEHEAASVNSLGHAVRWGGNHTLYCGTEGCGPQDGPQCSSCQELQSFGTALPDQGAAPEQEHTAPPCDFGSMNRLKREWGATLEARWENGVAPALTQLRAGLTARNKQHSKQQGAQEQLEAQQQLLAGFECPLGIDHPPTGVEFCLGCSMCQAEGKEQAVDPQGAVNIPEVAAQKEEGKPAQPDHEDSDGSDNDY